MSCWHSLESRARATIISIRVKIVQEGGATKSPEEQATGFLNESPNATHSSDCGYDL